MTNAVQRQSVAAGNLANLDTPGYKSRTVTFGDVLDGELQAPAAMVVARMVRVGMKRVTNRMTASGEGRSLGRSTG